MEQTVDFEDVDARLSGHDHICDVVGRAMCGVRAEDPKMWMRARIAQLKREIAYLEAKLAD
ncbi:MAG TPA: hypothetical protein VKE70_02995 [Candidatus Solibacter sp.]|nr:hypothetical protein [Candidatus Solibacter sp.]